MSGLARIYQAQFERAPTRTLMIVNGSLNAIGDFSAQGIQSYVILPLSFSRYIIGSKTFSNFLLDDNQSSEEFQWQHYDPIRTLRFMAFGATLGPFLGRWNRFLEHTFPLRSSGGTVSLLSLAKRVGVDQSVGAPLVLTYFITSMGFMEGKGARDVGMKYQEMFIPAMIANWKVWPAAQLINFRFMPLP
ncbi:hypothetical protein FRB96_004196 [Tulasnella sp. 330]|nr:hypothetical protein FRB96_004196 [Tulasnella sp. 330]KAG8873034.1 hypothetical protein FRB97_007069 [Tulasnella sp. 331]KAG8876823.1 hypothetical protein FRB98_007017 [Tulasnella sp. 332]